MQGGFSACSARFKAGEEGRDRDGAKLEVWKEGNVARRGRSLVEHSSRIEGWGRPVRRTDAAVVRPEKMRMIEALERAMARTRGQAETEGAKGWRMAMITTRIELSGSRHLHSGGNPIG